MRVRVDDLEKDKELLKSALQDSPLLHSASLIWPFSHLHDRSMPRSRSATESLEDRAAAAIIPSHS